MIGGNNGVKINAGGLRTTRLTQNAEDKLTGCTNMQCKIIDCESYKRKNTGKNHNRSPCKKK